MAWLDKAKEAEESKKAAQDWEAKAKASEDKSKELEIKLQEQETQRAEERNAVEAMNTEFQNIKQRLIDAEKKAEKKDEEIPDFDTDPEKAFNHRVRPLADVAVMNAAQTARILAQQQLDNKDMNNSGSMDGRLFRAWEQDILAQSSKYPTQQLMVPEAWLNIFYHIKGLRSDELANPELRKKKYPFLESGRGGTPSPSDDEKKGDKLTEEELRVCSRMGVTPENYLKRKKELKFVGA
jgi:hypothetical protein